MPIFVEQYQHFRLDGFPNNLAPSWRKVNALETDPLPEGRGEFAVDGADVKLDIFVG